MSQMNQQSLAFALREYELNLSGTLGQKVAAIMSINTIVTNLRKIIKHLQSGDGPTVPLIKIMGVHTILNDSFNKSINFKISVEDIASKDGRELINALAQPGMRIRIHVMYKELARLITALNQLPADTNIIKEISVLKRAVLLHISYLELLIAGRYKEL